VKVITKYDDLLLTRFLFGRLPNPLRRVIDAKKYELYEKVRKIKTQSGRLPVAEEFVAFDDHVYQVRFSLGKILRDDPDDDGVQELHILRVNLIPGLRGIR
jgi:hypothetical protein